MEIIRGKQTSFMDAAQLMETIRGFEGVHIDLGTGDGRFVKHMARMHPRRFIIGVDACRENLYAESQQVPANSLFVIANAEALPVALHGTASYVNVNFPWGSLISGLLTPNSAVIDGLYAVSHPAARIEIYLNAGAVSEAGWDFDAGVDQVRAALIAAGFRVRAPIAINGQALKSTPTTWAKRLAFGRDPRAMLLHVTR